ncbi:hypothetical protein [Gemmobacter serpentinus]|nr:hypothetical protein [Gemmobacter serpentinus]
MRSQIHPIAARPRGPPPPMRAWATTLPWQEWLLALPLLIMLAGA